MRGENRGARLCYSTPPLANFYFWNVYTIGACECFAGGGSIERIYILVGGFWMGGRRVGGQRVLVQLGDGVAERIDGLVGFGRRSDFIRSAIDAALYAREGVAAATIARVSSGVVLPVAASDRWSEDQREMMEALRGRRFTVRRAAAHLGWAEMRVERAARALSEAGLLAFSGSGVLEVL